MMIYGATGYTGRLIAHQAVATGIPLILAGRNHDELARMARELNVPWRAFSLTHPEVIDDAITDLTLVLNCAGPFRHTAEALMNASLRKRVHYLDIAAELDSYRLAETCDNAAMATGTMLLPGCGGSVAMLGCLAGYALQGMVSPLSLLLALHVAGPMSRGSAISAAENLAPELLVRREGALIRQHAHTTQRVDFGETQLMCFPVTLPDLITAWKSTAIPNINTWVHVIGAEFPQGDLSTLPDGPTAEQRETNRYQAVAEVTAINGDKKRMLLDTVNGYSFTALAAVEAARRVLGGEVRPGFQTPAGLFGQAFAMSIAGTRITELSSGEPERQ